MLSFGPRQTTPQDRGSWRDYALGGKNSCARGRKPHMTVKDHCDSALALAEPPDAAAQPRRIDRDAVQRAARELLRALGADVDAQALEETPRRVADAYAELLTPQPFRATTFPNDDGYDQLIVARAIPFHSLCMHHLLPFHGEAHIAYLPGERIVGLSKLGRVVEFFSRDLQIQERLTTQVADWLRARARAQGRRGRLGGRAPLHVAARRAEARRQDRDFRPARPRPRRPPHPPGVPGPDNEDTP